MYCMVSWIASPAVTTPPGELMYMKMSFFGFSDSRKSSWAVTRRRHMVLDRARDEHDPLAQQPRIDVEAALAPVGLLDDDGNELRNNILMVDHGKRILFGGAAYIGVKPARFKAAVRRRAARTCRTVLRGL